MAVPAVKRVMNRERAFPRAMEPGRPRPANVDWSRRAHAAPVSRPLERIQC